MSDIKAPLEISKAEAGSLTPSIEETPATPLHETPRVSSSGFLGFFHKLSVTLGAETVGCEPVPEKDRDPTQGPWSMFSVWTTTNLLVSAFSTGSLGPTLYGLGFWDSFLAIIFFHALGNLAVGVYSVLSFQLGMRSMIIARYSFGYWAVKILVVLNAFTCIGVSLISHILMHSNANHTCSGSSLIPLALPISSSMPPTVMFL
jgi:purine-cytosine permease-like protein